MAPKLPLLLLRWRLDSLARVDIAPLILAHDFSRCTTSLSSISPLRGPSRSARASGHRLADEISLLMPRCLSRPRRDSAPGARRALVSKIFDSRGALADVSSLEAFIIDGEMLLRHDGHTARDSRRPGK